LRGQLAHFNDIPLPYVLRDETFRAPLKISVFSFKFSGKLPAHKTKAIAASI